MISARAGTGWQTVLADLSIILFMVTASALSQAPDGPVPAPAARGASPISPQGEPLALYRAEPGAPPLREWLSGQAVDPRQQLTIIAHYRPGTQSEAVSRASALAGEAGQAGARARIVVEPGEGGVTASLAYDLPEAGLARPAGAADENGTSLALNGGN